MDCNYIIKLLGIEQILTNLINVNSVILAINTRCDKMLNLVTRKSEKIQNFQRDRGKPLFCKLS